MYLFIIIYYFFNFVYVLKESAQKSNLFMNAVCVH